MAGAALPPDRSAVSAIMAESTPGTERTASSTRLRTGSQALTAPASTLIEKNTLPSLMTISEIAPVSVTLRPSGAATAARRSRICSL